MYQMQEIWHSKCLFSLLVHEVNFRLALKLMGLAEILNVL